MNIDNILKRALDCSKSLLESEVYKQDLEHRLLSAKDNINYWKTNYKKAIEELQDIMRKDLINE